MIRQLKAKYWHWRAKAAANDMRFIMGLHNATDYQLRDNISYQIAKAKRDYYWARVNWFY